MNAPMHWHNKKETTIMAYHKTVLPKMYYSPSLLLLFPFFFLSIFSFIVQSSVPSSKTFRYVNDGNYFPFMVGEYGSNFQALPIYTPPFSLYFYNITPHAFTLAIGMATAHSDSIIHWVWEANRGNPVGLNATLTFGKDGNLVLASGDGRKYYWATNTANKGVVGLKLLPNGNLVLHDKKGNFVWQSFDHPTDTLVVGQPLRLGGPTKIVSRASEKDNSNGVYSFVMEDKRFAMYYKSPKSPTPFIYFSSENDWLGYLKKGPLEYLRLHCDSDIFVGGASELVFNYRVANSSVGGGLVLTRPYYNATYSFLRLDMHGNLRAYTFNNEVIGSAWAVTFTLFSRESWIESECQLPERCNKFGLCKDNQCVACPLKQGLMGWSEDCEPAKPPPCGSKDFHYYKLEGVDHFMCKYWKGDGPVKEDGCLKKCSGDCKCLGFFYNKETSRCWIAYDLKTLTKVANSTHVGYIKVANH